MEDQGVELEELKQRVKQLEARVGELMDELIRVRFRALEDRRNRLPAPVSEIVGGEKEGRNVCPEHADQIFAGQQ